MRGTRCHVRQVDLVRWSRVYNQARVRAYVRHHKGHVKRSRLVKFASLTLKLLLFFNLKSLKTNRPIRREWNERNSIPWNTVIFHFLLMQASQFDVKMFVLFAWKVSCVAKSVHVFYVQSAIYEQFDRDTGFSNIARNSARVTDGRQFPRLLNDIYLYNFFF